MEATLFKNGGSQALRIPAQFRFEGDRVDCTWSADLNALIVRPKPMGAWDTFFKEVDKLPTFSDRGLYPRDAADRFDLVAYLDAIDKFEINDSENEKQKNPVTKSTKGRK